MLLRDNTLSADMWSNSENIFLSCQSNHNSSFRVVQQPCVIQQATETGSLKRHCTLEKMFGCH